ncbi:MAG: glycosyltransferase family 4 protein, partial [Cyanobacteria bacterium J06642_11]
MNVLFLHPNFPAQFRHLATHLGADPTHQIVFITACEPGQIEGVQKVLYKPSRQVSDKTHRYVRDLESSVLTGQAAWRAAEQLKTKQGFEPDVIYAHVGWGPGLFLKDLFPKARYLGFFEWFYQIHGSDVDFNPDDLPDADQAARLRIRNASILIELANCDAGLVPTHWQKQQFPSEFHPKLQVLHDGINTTFCQPKPEANLILPPVPQTQPATPKTAGKGFGAKKAEQKKSLSSTELIEQSFRKNGLDLSHTTEVVTYVARGMDPYRGFPQFMAAVEQLQKMRSHCHVVVVGQDRVAYGSPLSDGRTYREKALQELDLDLSRLHFTGQVSYDQLLQVYQASTVHVYLTVPFVLSWSMLEAMASGCVVLGSKTPPVEEVIQDGVNGFLVDFWDVGAIAEKINDLLDRQNELTTIRQQARTTILKKYDLKNLLHKHINFLMGTSHQEV